MSKTHQLSFTAEHVDELLDKVDKGTVYQDATADNHGLMSATDKIKLDALPTAQQIDGALNDKVDKETGKGLSKNDYTDADKAKVASALQTETDPTVPSWAKQSNKPSYDYSEIGNTPDLSGFITNTVNNLTNYYLKSETYTQIEVNALIGAIRQFHYEIYATLPQSGASNVLYLIGPTGSGADKYEEYVYANNAWTKIGDTSIDLSGYVTATALDTALADYPTTANLTNLLAGKQDTINDLEDIRSGSALGATAVQEISIGTTTTGAAGTDASVTNSGTSHTPVLNFTIPKGADGADGRDAVNPFKGWYASSASLPDSPSVGDYAYVKGSTSSDPAEIYECTTDGTWSDSGRTADTSNVQTFASGEHVNQTKIDDTNLVNPASNALAKAKDVKKVTPHYENSDDYVIAYVDNNRKLLLAVNKNGEVVIPLLLNDELRNKVDFVEGKTLVNDTFADCLSATDDTRYISLVLSDNNRIIEAVTADGKKIIGDFADETKQLIRDIVGQVDTNVDFVQIPTFSSNLVSPVPMKVFELDSEYEDDEQKGLPTARYEIELPLSNVAFNIRFKFRLVENLLNENKSAVIAKLGGKNIVTAAPAQLTQMTGTRTYEGETVTHYTNALAGGISLNGSSVARTSNYRGKQNIGSFAFYVKYKGAATIATLSNDGEKFTLSEDGVGSVFAFSQYTTVYDLYTALLASGKFDMACAECEDREPSELAKFDSVRLNGAFFYKQDNQNVLDDGNSPFFIPYAVDEDWHVVEVVNFGNNVIYSTCDGVMLPIGNLDNGTLVLGGECEVMFKDLEVRTNTQYDAELVKTFEDEYLIISSANQFIVLFEGHGMSTLPTEEFSGDDKTVTVDRLRHLFNIMKGKGYIPVTIEEVADYYRGNIQLPKRCFVPIFDDYRFNNCMNLTNRAVFAEFGVKPALALITERTDTITHNGETIDELTAAMICWRNDFHLVSHTSSHRDVNEYKASEYFNLYRDDLYSADLHNVNGSILVYPFGESTVYLQDTLKWLGFRLAINVQPSGFRTNNRNRSAYNLTRYEVGVRVSLENITKRIL